MLDTSNGLLCLCGEIDAGTYLDGSVPGTGNLLSPLQSFVEIGAIQEIEATENFLGLGKWAVGEYGFAALSTIYL